MEHIWIGVGVRVKKVVVLLLGEHNQAIWQCLCLFLHMDSKLVRY